MKLLLVTQVVDVNHPILGFFHRWIEEFAKHCDSVEVIALQVGEYDLPKNVRVHSLGKELGISRVAYVWRFYKFVWQLRSDYDAVFVHMNQVYVILGAVLWRFLHKKIGLWYAHGAVSPSLYLATRLTSLVFTSTPQGFRIPTKKLNVVGQGIDMGRFTYQERVEHSVLELITVGRIASSKQLETLLEAAKILKDKQVPYCLRIIGSATTDNERHYAEKLYHYVVTQGLQDQVIWHGNASQMELPKLLAAADIFIHDGATNSLDKVLVEAVASGVPTISSNPSYRYILGEDMTLPIYFLPRDSVSLAANIQTIAALSLVDKNTFTQAIAQKVQREHSLPNLVSGIVGRY